MKKTSKPYILLFGVILLVMSFSTATSQWMRGVVAALLSPLWELVSPLQIHGKQTMDPAQIYKSLQVNENSNVKEPSVDAVPAKVIFRSPSTWNSSLWINVGEENNSFYTEKLIAKNSPVLVGDSVVGVVDYVGKKQSRVRLITDSGLVPSVRVARGQEQNKIMVEYVNDLLAYINTHGECFEDHQAKLAFENDLINFKQKLLEKKHTWYLAKGEIQGLSQPLWRTDSHSLRGSGFNYDFEDFYGPARDLRSGEPLGAKDLKSQPLVKVNDLLITTGMDGVFPPGLKVALVTKVDLLKEGDYAYELDAKPCVGNLDHLTWVYVIAPLGYDVNDQPEIH